MKNQNTMMIVIGLVIVVLIGFFVIKKIMYRKSPVQSTSEFVAPAMQPLTTEDVTTNIPEVVQ